MSVGALENPGYSQLCVKRRPAPTRGLGRNPRRRRLPKHTWFIIISAFCPSGGRGTHGDTWWQHSDTRWHSVPSVQPSRWFHANLFLRLRLQTDLDEGRTQGDSKRRSFQIPVTCNPWPRWLFKLSVTILPLDKEKVIPELMLHFAAASWVQDHDGGGFCQSTDQAVQWQCGISGWSKVNIPTRTVVIKQL